MTVVYDLAVAESGGPDASTQHLTAAVEARGGSVIRIDHWGRRRMAYPISGAIDGDYLVSRINLDPAAVSVIEAAFRIDERVYRYLVVRADELLPPPAPREPRRAPDAAAASDGAPAPQAAAEAPAAAAPTDEAPAAPVAEEVPATTADAAALGEAEASPAPVAAAEDSTPPGETNVEPSV